MYSLEQPGLRTDVAGMPLDWIGYREAARLYHLGQVVYSCGVTLYRIRGGHNAVTGRRSVIEVNSIIATRGEGRVTEKLAKDYVPPLSNEALFARDACVCMYCGEKFQTSELSRDHVTPLSRGGTDGWANVVTACKRCNNYKAGRTPEEAGVSLLAVPFAPTHAEYVYLRGRRVLADQMEFLQAHFPRTSPLHGRLTTNLALPKGLI
ncbi:MAG: HNH endonuclease [Gammaproteobacteria bacterium]|nr:HNH endonuclease [Gammaproteobacteria bacterium]